MMGSLSNGIRAENARSPLTPARPRDHAQVRALSAPMTYRSCRCLLFSLYPEGRLSTTSLGLRLSPHVSVLLQSAPRAGVKRSNLNVSGLTPWGDLRKPRQSSRLMSTNTTTIGFIPLSTLLPRLTPSKEKKPSGGILKGEKTLWKKPEKTAARDRPCFVRRPAQPDRCKPEKCPFR